MLRRGPSTLNRCRLLDSRDSTVLGSLPRPEARDGFAEVTDTSDAFRMWVAGP